MIKILISIITILLLISCENNDIEIKKKVDKSSKNKIILALWDSLTAWYNLDLADSYPMQLQKILTQKWYDYKVINAWVSWNTTLQLLDRLDLYLTETDKTPEIAIIVIWWNDWLRWTKISDIEENIEQIINRLKEKNIKIVLWWMKIPPNLWISYGNDFFNIYEKVTKKTSIYLINFFLEWVAWKHDLNLSDWIHPNKKWYEIISKNVFEFLKNNNLIQND